ncbi:MAG: ABC transporter permease, partial [Thermoplasmata archaeon]
SGPFWLIPSALLSFAYLSEVQETLGGTNVPQDAASVVLIHLTDPGTPETDRSRLASAFPALTLITVADILGEIQNEVGLYRTFGTLIAAVGIVVAGLFATTVLVMSVDDRAREMALLRALGFSPGWIARELALEGLLLAGFGLAVGAPLGAAGALAMDRFLLRLLPGLPAGFSFISFDPGVQAATLLIVVAVGLGAAALPILRALRIPVAQELRAP